MKDLKIKGIYRHFKGDYYIVEDIAKNADSLDEYVVYRGLYEESQLWIRSKEDFVSEVNHEKYPNVKQQYKFELQDIKSLRR